MTKPIALIIRDTKKAIINAVNDSHLTPTILEQIIAPIHDQISQMAAKEIELAEQEYNDTLTEEDIQNGSKAD